MLPPSPPAMMTAIFMLTLSYANGFATLPTELDRPQRCQLERTYKMIGYNCANLNLKEIPQQLKSNLEIFDLSFNRIRDLDQESFSRYGAVKYLYLFENMIQNIEEGTFSGLTNLEALDLSFNALKTIPLEIFELPVLRNLYAGHNALTELESDLVRLRKPIKAPLQVLGLPDCRLSRLPDFGILPDLWQLNISSNPMKKLTLEQFSPMCHLKTLDLNNTQIAVCSCQILTAELTLRRTKVMFPPLYCIPLTSLEQDQCRAQVGAPLDAEKVADFHQCMDVRNSRQLDTEAKTAWLKISAAVVGCIIVFATILYCLHRRNVNERRTKGGPKHRKPIAISDNINRVMAAQAQTVTQEAPAAAGPGERVKSDKLLSDCD